RTQAAEAPPRRDPARQAPAGTEAARVQADDVRPDSGQGARPDRGDPAAPGRGEEAREGTRGERGRQEGAGRVEGGRGQGGGRPSAAIGGRRERAVGTPTNEKHRRAGRRGTA